MRKATFLILISSFFVVLTGNAQVTIAGWDFSTSSNYGVSPLSASTTASNVTVGGLTRGSGYGTLSGTAAGSAWGSVNFTVNGTFQNEVDANKFFYFTITSNSGYTVSLSGISAYNIRRSSSGPTNGQWQYKIGSGSYVNIGSPITWGTATNSSGNPQSAIDLSTITDLQNVVTTSTITIRLVCYGATANTGTNYLKDLGNTTTDDLIVLGTVAAEPTTAYKNVNSESSIYTSNGNVMVNASAGQKVEIYNSLGQRLKSVVATAGLNTISVNAKGVVLVKTANELTKVIL